jgi:hypothetical protein
VMRSGFERGSSLAESRHAPAAFSA